jgi:hypothetical protein
MKKLLVVCLGVLVLSSVVFGAAGSSEAFGLADRVGEPGELSFFLFSTSAGNYIVRHDGMGEFTSPKGMRRVFTLRVGARGRIEQIYFLEHEGDVFIFYEVNDAAFLVRMEQTRRKMRWIAPIPKTGAPVIDGESVIVNSTEIRKADGKIIRQD